MPHKKFACRPAAERFMARQIKAGKRALGPYEVGRFPHERYEVQWETTKNPQLLFHTRAAALKYAREHGAKNFSVRKLKRGRA